MFSFIPFTPGVLIKLNVILSSGYNNSNFSHLPGLNCTGITLISFDVEDRTMTVRGDNFDVVSAGTRLNRLCETRLVSFGTIKEHEEGEHRKAEADKANKRKNDKSSFTFLSRMCISDK